ncbi:aminotransferase class I/II-fold pyridoxal phosphate-dependent enzyme [Mucilaginibacter ginkgonis]|uniref:GDP-perosamine synthase n=1 Tax=Mucilaginibacter ginkgonis TaxID=2682091 RepID=A0A6I4I6N2_9SPHI|nr:aminotransferase class I/II-fold pyridoxal phosphate-dependent enzyme [Mucilaginibacter ginkgonis]QQL50837.1 aminotransferase class I/II-fold pyridoxal phosphate-dependent enzyme [Mucilaginibacter ginkgonis]
MDVKELTVQCDQNIKSALEGLNTTGLGILFVTDNNNILSGIITDGDIRRALLAGKELSSAIKDVMNLDYTSLPVDTDNSVILDAITNKVKIIPLVDVAGKLVDYASINKIRRISVASPLLNGNELAYVTDCIKSSWISSQGKYVREFEKIFTDYHGGMPALAVSNGTVALHLALDALGITKGDEVLVADLTFAASVNSIIYTGATPVLIDIEPDTWNIDLTKAEEKVTANTKAIMPVHLYGHPCDMDAVAAFAKKYNLLVIEDCAEALGSFYNGKPVGVFGDVSTYSFYGNKTITTGEGGMVVFKDSAIAERAAMLRDHGMQKTKRYWHAEVGYNYRLTNIQAAIGVAQFEKIDEFLAAKRHIAKTYNQTLARSPYFQIPAEKENTVNSYWLYTFLVNESAPFKREELMEYLNNTGVETRPVFFPMHQMPPYLNFGKPEDLKVSIHVSECGMSLPSSVNLTDIELNHICNSINEFVKKFE